MPMNDTNQPMGDNNQPISTLAVRLIFEYEGDQVRLVSQQPVDVAITGFDITRTQRAGYYVDTRDAAGRTLARVPVRHGFSSSAEVFPEQPGEPIRRVDVAKPRGAFTVVVPAPGGADHVSVVRVAPAAPAAPAASDTPLSASRAPAVVAGDLQITDLGKFPLQVSR